MQLSDDRNDGRATRDNIDAVETGNTLAASQAVRNNVYLGQLVNCTWLRVWIHHFFFCLGQTRLGLASLPQDALDRTDGRRRIGPLQK